MDAVFDYLLDLSMAIAGADTDQQALREAHGALAAMNDDCRPSASMWPAFPASADPVSQRTFEV